MNLDFRNNAILSCFFFLFLGIDLNVLILAAIAQIFKPTAGLLFPTGIASKEVKVEIQIHPVIVEAKTTKFSI